ncbi:MAG: hypothetical protein QOD58_2377, partial [Mycobacterium sp.]|nr:hypothetical protein [Mycobacterium sp.]
CCLSLMALDRLFCKVNHLGGLSYGVDSTGAATSGAGAMGL